MTEAFFKEINDYYAKPNIQLTDSFIISLVIQQLGTLMSKTTQLIDHPLYSKLLELSKTVSDKSNQLLQKLTDQKRIETLKTILQNVEIPAGLQDEAEKQKLAQYIQSIENALYNSDEAKEINKLNGKTPLLNFRTHNTGITLRGIQDYIKNALQDPNNQIMKLMAQTQYVKDIQKALDPNQDELTEKLANLSISLSLEAEKLYNLENFNDLYIINEKIVSIFTTIQNFDLSNLSKVQPDTLAVILKLLEEIDRMNDDIVNKIRRYDEIFLFKNRLDKKLIEMTPQLLADMPLSKVKVQNKMIEAAYKCLPTPTEKPVHVSIPPETLKSFMNKMELSKEEEEYILKNFDNKINVYRQEYLEMGNKCQERKKQISILIEQIKPVASMISEINNARLRTIGFKLTLSKEDKVALSNIIILNIMRLNLTTIQQFDLSAVEPKTWRLILEIIYDIEGILASLPTPTEKPVQVSIPLETLKLIIDASELSEEYKKYILKNSENKLDPKAMLTECEEIKNSISELQKEIQKLNKINSSKSSRGI